MSGNIINPLSSDFNPTSSISFSSESIPIAAYGLIGLTSLTLAYVTLIASSQGGKSPASSATSMLPSIFSPKTPASPSMVVSPFGPVTASAQAASSIPMAQAVPVTPTPEQGPLAKPAMGGKTSRHKKDRKHKKTKRSKR